MGRQQMEERWRPSRPQSSLDAEPDGRDATHDRDLLRLNEVHEVTGCPE